MKFVCKIGKILERTVNNNLNIDTIHRGGSETHFRCQINRIIDLGDDQLTIQRDIYVIRWYRFRDNETSLTSGTNKLDMQVHIFWIGDCGVPWDRVPGIFIA